MSRDLEETEGSPVESAGSDAESGHADEVRTLARVGLGLVAGALCLLAVGTFVLPAFAALVVAGLALAAWAAAQRRPRLQGLWAGLLAAAGLLLVDFELDPLGASVGRSAATTAAIGVGVVIAAVLVERDVLSRFVG